MGADSLMSTENNKTDFGFTDVSKEEKVAKVNEVFSSVAAKYDLMNDLMSFGMHRCWKRYFVGRSAIHSGDNVCDLATGSGDIALLIAKKLADTGKLTISDINPDMLVLGKDKLLNAGFFKNIDSTIANAEQLPFEDNSFDVVTIAFGLRNVADKKKALSEMLRVIKPGGKVMVMEFSQPQLESIEFLYNKFSFNIIPLLGKKFAGDAESYRYLVESIRRHPNQEILKSWFYEAGFDGCDVTNLAQGIVAIHKGVKF